MNSVDVVVIGAGAAGLAAAREVSRAGRSAIVLEARERVGGRVHTLRDPAHPLAVELGAEFVDVPGPDWDALRAACAVAYRSVGGQWEVRGGQVSRSDWDSTLGPVMDRLDPPPAEDQTFLEFLDGRCADLDDEQRAAAIRYVEGFHAADAGRVGVHWIAAASEGGGGGGGDVRHHPLPGFDAVIAGLRAGLGDDVEVRLNSVVTEIRWSRGVVEVRSRSADGNEQPTVRATRAIITLPLGVLQAAPDATGYVRFVPALADKEAAARGLEMGAVVKVTMRFREAIWDTLLRFPEGEPGDEEVKMLMTTGAFPAWWTASPVQAPILTAWAGGSAARRIIDAGADPVRAAVESLAEMLGVDRERVEAELEAAYTHDWSADPFSRGAYSYFPVGGSEARDQLQRPVEDTLFFAGEVTAPDGNNATVAGAIESGERAGREVLAVLG